MHPMMRAAPSVPALAMALLVSLVAPTAADALSPPSLMITDSANNFVPLVNGAQIANLDAMVAFAVQPDAGSYTYDVEGPDGRQNGWSTCYLIKSNTSELLDLPYLGNGTYTVRVTLFPESLTCEANQGQSAEFTIVQEALVTPNVPGGGNPLLTRRPRSSAYSLNSYLLKPSLPVGTTSIEVQYARSARVNPDGTLAGADFQDFLGKKQIGVELRTPGIYTFVARALGRNGDSRTPWSAPQQVVALAPFDLAFLKFPGSRGHVFTAVGKIRASGANGRVVVSLARGKTGGRFRRIGSPTIERDRFSVRFRAPGTKAGVRYRIKVTYAGGDAHFIQPGSEVRAFTAYTNSIR